jgi:predicted  nucleic acid-binding Zn-ribbon protein
MDKIDSSQEGYKAVTTPETVKALVEERNKAQARIRELEAQLAEANARADIWERNYAASGDKDLDSIIAQKDKSWADYNAAIERAVEAEARAEAAEKVADAAVRWHEAHHDVSAYPPAFYALLDAVREYRARAEPPSPPR